MYDAKQTLVSTHFIYKQCKSPQPFSVHWLFAFYTMPTVVEFTNLLLNTKYKILNILEVQDGFMFQLRKYHSKSDFFALLKQLQKGREKIRERLLTQSENLSLYIEDESLIEDNSPWILAKIVNNLFLKGEKNILLAELKANNSFLDITDE